MFFTSNCAARPMKSFQESSYETNKMYRIENYKWKFNRESNCAQITLHSKGKNVLLMLLCDKKCCVCKKKKQFKKKNFIIKINDNR